MVTVVVAMVRVNVKAVFFVTRAVAMLGVYTNVRTGEGHSDDPLTTAGQPGSATHACFHHHHHLNPQLLAGSSALRLLCPGLRLTQGGLGGNHKENIKINSSQEALISPLKPVPFCSSGSARVPEAYDH